MKRAPLLALVLLAGCNMTGNPTTDVPAVLQTIQPIESDVACLIQSQANAAAAVGAALAKPAVGTALAKPAVVAGSIVASAIAGTFCNGLHAGATLPVPVPVAGTTALQGPAGAVVLPVPVPAS